MAITKTIYGRNGQPSTVETYFAGRVLKVEELLETRNHSDTLDYTDFRSTRSTYALVWLGTHNYPPQGHRNREHVSHYTLQPASAPSYGVPRDLEFHEQFAWVDCTNLFSDRNGHSLEATEDGFGGEPLMHANYSAWVAYHKAAATKRLAEAAAKEAEQARLAAVAKAQRDARQAKKDAAAAVTKVQAEADFKRLPAKGTTVTVDGFTGVVFWQGVTKYRNVWNARVGVRNSKGDVQWIGAEKF